MLIVSICYKQHWNRCPYLSCHGHKRPDPSLWLVPLCVAFLGIPCCALALLVGMFVSPPFNAALECKQWTSQYIYIYIYSAQFFIARRTSRWTVHLLVLQTFFVILHHAYQSFLAFFHLWVSLQVLIRHLDFPEQIPCFKNPASTSFISIQPYHIISYLFIYFLQLHGNNINTWRHWEV